MSRDNPTNSDDIVDSRSIIERIEELEEEREELVMFLAEALDEFEEHAAQPYDEATAEQIEDDAKLIVLEGQILDRRAMLKEWDEDSDGVELKELKELAADCSDYSDWKHGVTLIRDSYFKEYAQEFADDIGAIDKDAGWPNDCIDWERAARELQMDYTSVEWGGVTYWYR